MKKLAYLAALLMVTACGSDNDVLIDENGKISNVEPAATTSNIETVSKGSGGSCLALDFNSLNCGSSVEELESSSTPLVAINMPIELQSKEGTARYQITDETLNSTSLRNAASEVQNASTKLYDYVLYTNVTRTNEIFFNFLEEISDEKGIDASGAINSFSMDVNDSSVPIAYSVDCTGDGTAFHMVAGAYGIKTNYTQTEENPEVYEVTTTGVTQEGKEVSNVSYCTAVANEVETAANAVGDEVSEVANDIEEGAEDLADQVEKEVDEADSQLEDAADKVEEEIDEVDSNLEDAADEVEEEISDAAENVEQGAKELANNVKEETKEVRVEAKEAADAIGVAVEETGEAIEEGAKKAGETVERGLDKAGQAIENGVENVQDKAAEVGQEIKENTQAAARATTEAVADGVEAAEKVVEETAAVAEGVANTIADGTAKAADAVGDKLEQEIDEARAENQEDTNALEDFVSWLRGLFR